MSEISEIPMIEQSPITKISQHDLERTISIVARKAEIEQVKSLEKPEPTLTPAAADCIGSVDATTTNRLKSLLGKSFGRAGEYLRSTVNKTSLTIAAVSTLASSGCGNIERQSVPPSTPTHVISELPAGMPSSTIEFTKTPMTSVSEDLVVPTPEPTSTPSIQNPPEYEYSSFENIKVAIDKEGLPVEYVLPDGKKVPLEKEVMRQLRESAMQSKEPEIITAIPVELPNEKSSSKEHPEVLKLPEDVLSEEELEKRGVRVIQAENTNFYIREGAFGKDAPLADFNNTGRKLTIILVNRKLINEKYLLDDFQYKQLAATIPDKELDEYREKKTSDLKEEIEDLRKQRSTEGEMVFRKTKLYTYQNIITKEEDTDEILSAELGGRRAGGFYIQGDNPTIVIAVGKLAYPDLLALYFDRNGTVKESIHPISLYSSIFPEDKETYPNPADFSINPDASPDKPDSRPYGSATTPGFIFRHEVAHDSGGKAMRNEYNADLKAMKGIENAWEKWEKSRFTDNSGYSFVFSLPGGRYILTEHKQSNANTPSDT